jgi:hypothetical protein
VSLHHLDRRDRDERRREQADLATEHAAAEERRDADGRDAGRRADDARHHERPVVEFAHRNRRHCAKRGCDDGSESGQRAVERRVPERPRRNERRPGEREEGGDAVLPPDLVGEVKGLVDPGAQTPEAQADRCRRDRDREEKRA